MLARPKRTQCRIWLTNVAESGLVGTPLKVERLGATSGDPNNRLVLGGRRA
jgi:hypothetical protein